MALPKDFLDRLMKDYGVTLAALGDEDHAEAYFKCLELGYQRGLSAAIASLPEKNEDSLGPSMSGWNRCIDQAKANIEKLKKK